MTNSTRRYRAGRVLIGVVWLLAAGLVLAAPAAFVPGDEGDGDSIEAAVSDDGRYVAFSSAAANLVAGDTNGLQDVFLHDRQTGSTVRVSAAQDGDQPDGYSESPALSADGRFVAFHSLATNLAPFDNNQEADVFVYDIAGDTLSRVSVTSTGAQAAGASYDPDISADGRYVVFTSTAVNLDEADESPWPDVFVHDRQTGQTSLISFNASGKNSAGFSDQPAISADGRVVAFASGAADIVSGDTNDYTDIFAHDRQAGKTTRVSVNSNGDETFAESYDPAVSADGRHVAFWSYAADLTGDDTGGRANVFVHDRQTKITTMVSPAMTGAPDGDSSRPRLSGDGRWVVFESAATNLIATDDNLATDIFIYDRETGETARVSEGVESPASDDSTRPAITADGWFVAFQSLAANLVAGDGNGVGDIFLRDRTAGTMERVSLASMVQGGDNRNLYLSYIAR